MQNVQITIILKDTIQTLQKDNKESRYETSAMITLFNYIKLYKKEWYMCSEDKV